MNRTSTGMMVLFVFTGLVCGLAFSVLIQPVGTLAQAPVPTAQVPSVAGQASSGWVQAASPAGPQAATALANQAFTYQGMLRLGGQPVNASCEFQFSAYDALTAGTQLGSQSLTSAVANGLFTVVLNGASELGPLDGRAVWIETAVRCPAGAGSYTTLVPRQALTAAPLAAGLVPHATIRADDTSSGDAALTIKAPIGSFRNPIGLQVAADPSDVLGAYNPVAVWGDSNSGIGVWGTTGTGSAISGYSSGPGLAGQFVGDVNITGKLTSRLKVTQVINHQGNLPVSNVAFTTNGGTLVLFYSGSGFGLSNGVFIGMNVLIDGNLVDSTGVFANTSNIHLAFIPKLWVVTNIGAGAHTLSLTKLDDNTLSDSHDIFTVTVLEMPY